MPYATQNLSVSRGFAKRPSEKSEWSGSIGTAVLAIDDGVWTINGKEIPKVSREYLLNFALQSLQDAYAGAESLTEAVANFEKKRDALIAGSIGTRAAGADEITTVQRIIMRRVLNSKKMTVPEDNAEIDRIFAKNSAKLDALVAEEIARRQKARERIAVEIDL